MKYTDLPQPAILIAHSRSGSTFLSHCLDSHPQICCERGGPFNMAHTWLKTGISHHDLAMALWQREGCLVSMFRITQRQFKNGYVTMETLREFQPKILYLSRRNVLRAFISSELATASVRGKSSHPLHSYQPVDQQELALDCATLVTRIDDYFARTEATLNTLSEFGLLHLTYEEITTPDSSKLAEPAAAKIVDFLGVNYAPMGCEMVKINSAPVIVNWPEVVDTLAGTDYEWMLN